MADYLDNPAGRIAATLRRVKEHGDGPPIQIWSSALGGGSAAQVYKKIARFMMLIDEAKHGFSTLEDIEQRPFYLGMFPFLDTLESRLFTHLNDSDMSAFKDLITDDKLAIVELMSRELHRHYRSRSIDSDIREEMLKAVRDLMGKILVEDGLSEQEKAYIVKLLRDVEVALLSYWLGGFDEIASSVAALAAGVANVSSETKKGWLLNSVTRIWNFLSFRSNELKAIASATKEVVAVVDDIQNLT